MSLDNYDTHGYANVERGWPNNPAFACTSPRGNEPFIYPSTVARDVVHELSVGHLLNRYMLTDHYRLR